MEKDKSRGLKHIKDKRKYKGNSVKDPKHVPVKLKRNLDSNWYRYEKEDDSQGFQLTSSTDFSILANAPITQGNRFQFKSDKINAEETANKTPHELFSLDLNLLNDSILTIPFYQRVGIAEEYFAEHQLKLMKMKAENNLFKYNEKYNSEKIVEYSREPSNINDNSDNVKEAAIIEERKEKNIYNIDEEKDIQEVVSKLNEVVKLETKEKKSDEDLEQWLDDILGE